MRLSIRWKLTLAVGIPALALYVIIFLLSFTRLQARGLARLEESATRLATLYSRQVDARMDEVGQVARSTAAALEVSPDLAEEQIYALLRATVRQNEMIQAALVAFAPYAFAPGRELFLPAVEEQGGTFEALDLAAGSPPYTSPGIDWYSEPASLDRPLWTGPFRRQTAAGGSVAVCRYAVPFHRDGAFRGVVAIDIPVQRIRPGVGFVSLENAEFSIIGRDGTYIVHPDATLVAGESIFSLAAAHHRSDLSGFGRRMVEGERGVERTRTLDGAGYEWLFFAPVQATGWTFVGTIPEEQITSFARSQLARGVLLLAAGMVIIIGSLFFVAARITRPVAALVAAVHDLSRGNLDAQVRGIGSSDEIGELIRAFNLMMRDLKGHMEARTRETAARQAVESEMRLARNIQTFLLPRVFPADSPHSRFDLHAVNLPAKQVAGDFFDFFFLSADTLALVMADVSGKGMPAALFMAVARTVLRSESLNSASPGQTLTRVNRILNRDNPGSMFVTLFVAWYDTRTGRLRYANAGHPLPYRIGGDGKVERFGEVTGSILGILDGYEYGDREAQMQVGDRMVLYTDGVPEAMSPAGEYFGSRRLAELLARHAAAPVQAICDAVASGVKAFQGQADQDDITILALQRLR